VTSNILFTMTTAPEYQVPSIFK